MFSPCGGPSQLPYRSSAGVPVRKDCGVSDLLLHFVPAIAAQRECVYLYLYLYIYLSIYIYIYIYIYISMCQSTLTRHALDVVNEIRTVGHCGVSELKK